jgi:hypothetical protein
LDGSWYRSIDDMPCAELDSVKTTCRIPLWETPTPGYHVSLPVVATSMSWTRAGVAVEVLSCVTRAQSRFSPATPPAGSQPVVDAIVRTLSCQTASVGRLSMILASRAPPGWMGTGGSTNGGTTPSAVRSFSGASVCPPALLVPVRVM